MVGFGYPLYSLEICQRLFAAVIDYTSCGSFAEWIDDPAAVTRMVVGWALKAAILVQSDILDFPL